MNTARPSIAQISQLVPKALASTMWDGDEPLMVFHDLDFVDERISRVKSGFGATNCLHTSAVKANPVIAVLSHMVSRGFGLECASWGEVELSLAAGAKPSDILFDSPAKTSAELDRAIALGMHINIDNFDELDRIAAKLQSSGSGGGEGIGQRIGIRINPQVGEGSIAITSVAGADSKFGIPIRDVDQIIEAYRRHEFLNGIHIHVGSQGVSLDSLLDAATITRDLVASIDEIRTSPIEWVDIGGGIPVRYTQSDSPFELEEYGAALAELWPELGHEVMMLTELGRWLHANAGYAVARVEYVKTQGEGQTIVSHAGADMFVRPVYQPEDWRHEFVVLDSDYLPRDEPAVPTRLAGPLCFGGDFLERDGMLPSAEPGDWVVVQDAGAYTLGMWSRHCNRTMPPVVGVLNGELVLLKRPESAERLKDMWT